ncbi:TRAP transporter small permease [Cohaesibacter haloalkalitolerans]|uniref:TRAP transporter small permease n=1 Tax=Cohaesibacter haloalkalitolerans TaxID=1162980 RepID=UPI0013C4F0F6|nr:TRAP transporter small permease [Cohaesibacter haloalkalitolerans]
MRTLEWVCSAIEKTINFIIIVCLMMMTAVIFYQVVLRYVFDSSNIWAEEFARYAFIWVVLLGAASALRRFQHIRIDFVVNLLPERAQKLINFINYILIVGFLATLIKYGIAISLKTTHQISAGLHIPMSFMYMSIPVGSALMLLFTVQIILRDFLVPTGANTSASGSK